MRYNRLIEVFAHFSYAVRDDKILFNENIILFSQYQSA